MQGIRCAFVKAHAGSCMEHRLWGPERRLLQLSGALAREERALNGSAGYSDIQIFGSGLPHCSELQVPWWCHGTSACVLWVWGVDQ